MTGLAPLISNDVGAEVAKNGRTGAPMASVPSPPLNVTVTAHAQGLYVNWTEPISDGGSEIINYLVYVYEGSLENWTYGVQCSFGEGTPLSTNVKTYHADLNGGWTYHVYVMAVNGYGQSESSPMVSITPFFGPNTPEDIATRAGDGYVNLTWSPPSKDGGKPVIAYDIERFRMNESYWYFDWLNSTVSASTFYFNDTGLVNGAQYNYWVRARNEIGQGWSWGLTAAPGLPSSPLNLTFSQGLVYVNLTWSPPFCDGGFPITNYSIYRDGLLLGNVSSSVTYLNDTSVQTGHNYFYMVRAVNSVGEGSGSAGLYVAMPYPPDKIWFLVPFTGDGYVDLLWWPPNDGGNPITEYRVRRYQWNETEALAYNWYNLTVPPTNITFFYGMDFVHFNDTAVTNGVVYHYEVAAVNAIGEADWTNTSVKVAISSPPYNLQWAGAGNHYVEMRWEAPMRLGGFPILSYNIYRNSTFLASVPGDTVTYRDTTVVNNVYYSYKVTAVNQVGESSASDSIDLRAENKPPPATNVMASIEEGYVNVTWTPPEDMSNVQGYVVERWPSGGGSVVSATVYAPGTYYHDSAGLVPGESYNYGVITLSLEDVYSGQWVETSASMPNLPGAPTGLQIVSGDGNLSLSWLPPTSDGGSAITKYVVYRGPSANSMTWLANTSVLAFTDTSVTNGTKYYYKVAAVNSLFEGVPSGEVNGTFIIDDDSGNGGEIDTTLLIIVGIVIVVVVAVAAVVLMRSRKK